jgi:large subunit ribosomal protein L9
MARSVKVVFREDVRGVAHAGDMKPVSPGYARNFLIPKGIAFEATASAIRQWETERQGAVSRAERLRDESKGLAEKISAVTVTLTAKASPEGKLFGSVGRQELCEALAKEGLTVDKRAILLPEALKVTGETTVPVRVGVGQDAQLKVVITAEQS